MNWSESAVVEAWIFQMAVLGTVFSFLAGLVLLGVEVGWAKGAFVVQITWKPLLHLISGEISWRFVPRYVPQ